MKDYAKITLTGKAVKNMTDEQWNALRNNIVADGRWDNEPYEITVFDDMGTMMVSGLPIVIGIEPDGYTHS